MRGKSWATDPPAPSVMRSGLLWCQFPGTMTCHVHGGQAEGKEKVQPKGHRSWRTPTASAARPDSVSPSLSCARLGDWKLTLQGGLRPFLPRSVL